MDTVLTFALTHSNLYFTDVAMRNRGKTEWFQSSYPLQTAFMDNDDLSLSQPIIYQLAIIFEFKEVPFNFRQKQVTLGQVK